MNPLRLTQLPGAFDSAASAIGLVTLIMRLSPVGFVGSN